ncbi:hypothetical protein B0H14DRAFT_2519242, partial [Mycena olivaceomarginata]
MQKTANFIIRYSSRSPSTRIVSLTFSTSTRDELDQLTRDFSSFKEQFDRGLAVQSGLGISDLVNAAALQQDNKVLQVLELQHRRSKRGHEPCLIDTRADILKDIEEWIDDVNAPNLFWLHGHPGTGKSAIATTIRDSLQSAGHLASSFFFRREDFTMQRPESLWCSVIYDLAQKYSAVRCLAVDQVNQQKIH